MADITHIFGASGFQAEPVKAPAQEFSDPILEFQKEAQANAGLIFRHGVIADGVLHRVPTPADKAGQTSGYYLYFANAIPSGMYGDWRTGAKSFWRHDIGRPLTCQEELECNRQKEESKKKAEQAREEDYQAAAIQAGEIINAMTPVISHEYLDKKGIKPTEFVGRHNDGRLIIPMISTDGEITSLQFISPSGKKRFLTGGKKGIHFLGNINDALKIYIVEGYATGVSVHNASGCLTVIAFDATNLRNTANQIRQKYPTAQIIIAADNDQHKPNNTGIIEATKAAKSINSQIIYPTFTDLTNNPSDFNDLAQLEGIDEVKKQLKVVDPLHLLDDTLLDLTKWQGKDPPELEWVLYPCFPKGDVTLLSAKGGSGKTLFAQMLLTSVATGKPFFGHEIEKGVAAAILCEDSPSHVWRRQIAINKLYDTEFKDLKDMVIDARQAAECELINFDRNGVSTKTEYWHAIQLLIEQKKPDLFIIDTAIDTFGDNVNDPARVRKFIRECLVSLASAHQCAIVMLGHTSKSSQSNESEFMGTEAWNNTVRSRLFMTKTENTNVNIQLKKSNYAMTGWSLDMVFDHDGMLINSIDTQFITDSIENNIETAFLNTLKIFNERQQNVSSNPGRNYAPKAIFKITRHKKLPWTVSDYEGVMERLLDQEVIILVPGYNRSKGKNLTISGK